MTNMRVAVAGTCGLALLIAREINDSTSHQLVILSRTVSAYLPLFTILQGESLNHLSTKLV